MSMFGPDDVEAERRADALFDKMDDYECGQLAALGTANTNTLGCGHANDWEPGFGARGATDDTSRCKACAHAAERAGLRQHDRFFAYLDGTARLTDWTGGLLATRVGDIRKSGARSLTKGWNREGLWTFRACDVHGRMWACRHWPDSGDYVRMRAIKGA